ncbi:hypothetical protein Bhyg_02102 [Pseudolycoriella hygida]|uniref:Uncharacterized protein n=1 Tax=Pseudolycoriella hygida TaxID=35572 RepID=A0A9Q0NB95_9DIPT|nr:hypothetical protein Bhyg_02102 [Pseudolycoriella hygida]
MSDPDPPSSVDQCETESVQSDTKSVKSTTSSIARPTGIKPPSVTTTRIGRPCCAGHLPKPGLPPPPEPKIKNGLLETPKSN